MAAPAHDAARAAPVVFFDGECPLCNRSVTFLAGRDRAGRLAFAHLQGHLAQSSLEPAMRNTALDGSVVLLEPDAAGRVSLRSAAILRALAHTSPRRRWLARLAESPFLVRLLDVPYAFVVRRRDRWFGRHDACAVPDPSFRARFLE